MKITSPSMTKAIKSRLPSIALLCLLSSHSALAQGPPPPPSTINAARSYAYGTNTGWIHFRPSAADGVRVMEWYVQGRAYGANTGWIDLGDGTPANLWQYTNTGADYGVNHDSAGHLSGYAYSANAGWINFGWTTAGDPNGPRFDMTNGFFKGYAWSANLGWINLNIGTLQTDSISRPDTDGDGLGDIWELAFTGNLTALTGTGDNDGDGRTNRDEYLAATNPVGVDAGDSLNILGVVRSIDGETSQPRTETGLRWLSRGSRKYSVEVNNDLASGSWNPYFEYTGTGGFIDATHIGSGHPARNFFRLRPLLPLP